ncbi:hypothetical protein [Flavobacterium sp.]|uniref:hypothetical protein n=1 Tax=Flavobacterium sp. TaxID=239 RepID=UPI00286D2045|nr:hypothetical protein [Flavobacterium sp.]
MKKKIIALSIYLISNLINAQENKLNYYFDSYDVTLIKNYNYQNGYPIKKIVFSNSKDSTYLLQIIADKHYQEAKLYDSKKKQTIQFYIKDISFKIDDLGNLEKPKLTDSYFHNHKKNVSTQNFENVEFERDTILNKTIIHLTKYKNKKLNKIIHEDYFIFQKKQKPEHQIINIDIQNLIKIHNLKLNKDDILTKTLCLINGKISVDIQYLEHKAIDYNLRFTMNN